MAGINHQEAAEAGRRNLRNAIRVAWLVTLIAALEVTGERLRRQVWWILLLLRFQMKRSTVSLVSEAAWLFT